MISSMIAYLKDDDGQTSTEYILLVAVVAMIVIKFKKKAEIKLGELTDQVFNTTSNFVSELESN